MTHFDEEYDYLTNVCNWPDDYSERSIERWSADFKESSDNGWMNTSASLRFRVRFALLVAARHPGLKRWREYWLCDNCDTIVGNAGLVRLLDKECVR